MKVIIQTSCRLGYLAELWGKNPRPISEIKKTLERVTGKKVTITTDESPRFHFIYATFRPDEDYGTADLKPVLEAATALAEQIGYIWTFSPRENDTKLMFEFVRQKAKR